jgi:nicotinate phosphoribosyltransferase
MSALPRTRGRLPSEIFDLPVEKMREGYYSDAYFAFTKRVPELDEHHRAC